MLIFGKDCGCDARKAYMQENPVAFMVLAAIGLVVLIMVIRNAKA